MSIKGSSGYRASWLELTTSRPCLHAIVPRHVRAGDSLAQLCRHGARRSRRLSVWVAHKLLNPGCRLCSVRRTELSARVLKMASHGVRAQEKTFSDCAIGKAMTS